MIKYIILNNSMVVHFKGTTYILTSEDEKYTQVLECINSGNLEGVKPILNIKEIYKDAGIALQDDGMIYLNGIPLDSFIKRE